MASWGTPPGLLLLLLRRTWLCVLNLTLGLLLATAARGVHGAGAAGLDGHFYVRRCPKLDQIVATRLRSHVTTDPSVIPALVRLAFHDCFSRGCDASIMLAEEVGHKGSETLRGFNVIEDIKAQVERRCPNTVSCADIIVLAARNAIRIARGPNIVIKYGRRDSPRGYPGAISSSNPEQHMNVNTLVRKFRAVGLNSRDLVALSGAHTFGQAHCPSFADQVQSNRKMPAAYRKNLLSFCAGRISKMPGMPDAGGMPDHEGMTPMAFMDPATPTEFDTKYYKNILQNKVLFNSDRTLVSNPGTLKLVKRFSYDRRTFFNQFAKSFIRMSEIGVFTGSQGKIRKYCSVP